MRRPLLACAAVSALLVILLAASCGSRKTTLGPDLPPETSVYIQGTVDTVNHRVHLYWFGSDPDGYVVAFAAWTLGNMGALAQPAVPALARAF